MTEDGHDAIPESVHDAAADWSQRRARGLSPAERRRFTAWLSANDQHRIALQEADQVFADGVELRPGALARGAELKRAPFHMQRRPRAIAAAASGVLAIMLLSSPLLYQTADWHVVAQAEAGLVVTRAGETRRITVFNGAVVTLAENSRLIIGDKGRPPRITLLQGHAHFVVPARQEALVISSGNATLETTEATFDLKARSSHPAVHVLAGRVALSSDGSQMMLEPTARALVVGNQRCGTNPTGVTIDQSAGMVTLSRARLQDAVAVINCHVADAIGLDSRVADIRITGAFRLDDPAGFANAVGVLYRLKIDRLAQGTIRITRDAQK